MEPAWGCVSHASPGSSTVECGQAAFEKGITWGIGWYLLILHEHIEEGVRKKRVRLLLGEGNRESSSGIVMMRPGIN